MDTQTAAQAVSLPHLAADLIDDAAESPNGRSARAVHPKSLRKLRQIMLALRDGEELPDHENPGEATVYVITGRVELTTQSSTYALGVGESMAIPEEQHGLLALEDAAVLLTVVKQA